MKKTNQIKQRSGKEKKREEQRKVKEVECQFDISKNKKISINWLLIQEALEKLKKKEKRKERRKERKAENAYKKKQIRLNRKRKQSKRRRRSITKQNKNKTKIKKERKEKKMKELKWFQYWLKSDRD